MFVLYNNKIFNVRLIYDKKTTETQYVETDEHPFHSNEISHSGMSFNEHDDKI